MSFVIIIAAQIYAQRSLRARVRDAERYLLEQQQTEIRDSGYRMLLNEDTVLGTTE